MVELDFVDIGVRLLGPLGIFIGVVVSAIMIRRQMRLNYDLAIRNKSVGYSLYANEHLRDARIKVDQSFGPLFLRTGAVPMEEINDTTSKDLELYASILTLLAHWENMALSIETGIADDEVCFEMVGSIVIQHVRVFKGFIDERRDVNSRSYRYLIALQRRWNDRLMQIPPSTLGPPIVPGGQG